MENSPRFAKWLLEIFSRHEVAQHRLGDFEEVFHYKVENESILSAQKWYWRQMLKSLPSLITDSIFWRIFMLKSYMKITFRTLLKHKTFSLINIAGLALSMAICLMIIIFIKDQRSSDRFHEKAERIVRIYTTDKNMNWDIDGWACTPSTLGPHISVNYPFIEDVVSLRKMWGNVLNTGTAISISGLYAQPAFLNIFSYQLKDGDPKMALDNPYSIIISKETANKVFGTEDPMHKILNIESLGDFTVTGVLKKTEHKSHFVFDALVSLSTVPSLVKKGIFKKKKDSLTWPSFTRYYTYALLKSKKDKYALEGQLSKIEKSIIPVPEIERFGFELQPLLDINLGINLTNSMPGTKQRLDIAFIPFLALLVMFLACFNYIILSIARSLRRAKEIGLRKVIGSTRNEVIKLFFCETFTVTFLALIAACAFILWLIPVFNGIEAIQNTNQQINIELMKEPALYIIFILFAIGVSIVAGLYPAFYLSSFQPANALKGFSRINGFSHLLTRKILMTIQFAVSLIVIIIIVYFNQLHDFWMNYDIGISTENSVSVNLRNINYETFRNEILTNNNITGVSFSSEIPIYGGLNKTKLISETIKEPRVAYLYNIDTEFIDNFEIELIAGRNFSLDFSTDASNSIIINEKAVQILNFCSPDDAIGQTISYRESLKSTIIGVVKDFNYRNLENDIDPLVFSNKPQDFKYANIHYAAGKKPEVKAFLPVGWAKLDKVHPVRYEFLEDVQEERDSIIQGTLNISSWASGFVIFIALFGLLGMATYTTEMRVQEISIRKVLGASVSGMAYLLSKDYIKLILYSAVFALPSAYFLSKALFQFFAFRPDLSLLVLLGALIFILALALLTIAAQTLKTVTANPVDSLRTE